MSSPKKANLFLIIILSILIVCLISQLIGVILLLRGGTLSYKMSEAESILLAEETIWMDETKCYRIIFSPQNKGGTIQDLKSNSAPICFYFGLPGTIEYWEMDYSLDNGDFQFSKDVCLGSCEFLYDSENEILELINFNIENTYHETFGKTDLIFYRSP